MKVDNTQAYTGEYAPTPLKWRIVIYLTMLSFIVGIAGCLAFATIR